jgi:hypothetical protein
MFEQMRRTAGRVMLATALTTGGVLANMSYAHADQQDLVYNATDIAQAALGLQVIEPVEYVDEAGLHIVCSITSSPGVPTFGPDANNVGDYLESGTETAETSCPVASVKTLTASVRIADGGAFPHNAYAAHTAKNNYVVEKLTMEFLVAQEPGPDITYTYTASVTSTTNTTRSICTWQKVNIVTHATSYGRC